MAEVTERVCWGERGPLPFCPAPERARVVESFLLADGRVAGLRRHESRFRVSCAALSLDVAYERLDSFLTEVRARLPRSGRWFPRLEAHRGSPGSPSPLVLWLRPAPEPEFEIRLWNGSEADPRRFPRCKGPDIPVLAALRERARTEGADDAVLCSRDGTLLETAHASLLWWRGDELRYPDPTLPRLAGVTSETVLDAVREAGGSQRPERARLADLAGAELWAVNALHGIRPVTGWARNGCPPWMTGSRIVIDHGRLEHYRARLQAATKPLDDLGKRRSGHSGQRPLSRVQRPLNGTRRRVRTTRLDFVVAAELVFSELFASERYAFWLDSSRVEEGLARFSFLGDAGGRCGEVLSANVGTGRVSVRESAGSTHQLSGSIFDVLEANLRAGKPSRDESLPFDLASGYVGYFGYEMKAECGSSNIHIAKHPDAQWMTASRMIAIDHETDRSWVLALSDGDQHSWEVAGEWVRDTAARLRHMRRERPHPVSQEPGSIAPEPWLDRPRSTYLADIAACQRSLRAGESYEICLTNTLNSPFDGRPLEMYQRLRNRNPAPYSAYLRFDDLYVLCSSPERFLKIDSQRGVESKPIKGTARRDTDPERDGALRDGLATSSKTRAENLMIVDLLRNDLGRICEIGTVTVPRFMRVESYATVHQLVSTIRGILRPDVSPVAAVRACFPGGSMTGAPKLRTMEIIDTLENQARGIYSGAIGFFGFQGTADLNIVIRTAVIQDGEITIGAGGAIVLDSDPADEFDEMVVKAASVTQAIAVSDIPEGLNSVPAEDTQRARAGRGGPRSPDEYAG